MPHSVTPEAALAMAPEQSQEDQDLDMTMAEAGVEGDDVKEASMEDAPAIKQEVKLEDLFADVESDEEFPSSEEAEDDVTVPSSPEGFASPM